MFAKFKINTLCFLGFLFSVFFLTTAQATTISYQVSLDTTSLNGVTGQLAFDFIDGGSPSNSLSISSFMGGVLGASYPVGAVSGDLPGTVTLSDTDFFNEYLIDFIFGTELSFVIQATNNPADAGSFPDALSFFLLDDTGFSSLISTQDATGADSLIFWNLGEGPVLYGVSGRVVFGSITKLPDQQIPEPATLALIGAGLLIGALFKPRAYKTKSKNQFLVFSK